MPVKVTALGFRLEKFLIYEVTKGGWAEAVGLKLGTLAIDKKGGKGGRIKFGDWLRMVYLESWSCCVLLFGFHTTSLSAKRVLAGSFFEGVKVFFLERRV